MSKQEHASKNQTPPKRGETVTEEPKTDHATATAGGEKSAPKGVDIGTGEVKDPPPKSPPPEPPKLERVELVKKIVAKDIVGRAELRCARDERSADDIKAGKDADPRSQPRQLYRVFGTVNGTDTGESNYGKWVAFMGSFEAIRLKDRKTFRSNKLFLQQPAEGLLLNALTEVKLNDANASVNFAFDIGVKLSERWVETDQGSSYEYTVESVFSTSQADPLAQLRQSAMQELPKLAGPSGS